MRTALWGLLLSIAGLPAPAFGQWASHAALEDRVPAVLERHKVPAVAIAVVREGRLVYSRTWGMAAPDRPADDATLFKSHP